MITDYNDGTTPIETPSGDLPGKPIERSCQILSEIMRLMHDYNCIVWNELQPNGFSLFPISTMIHGATEGPIKYVPENLFDVHDAIDIWSSAESIKKRLGCYPKEWKCSYCGGDGDHKRGPDGRVWHVDHVYPRKHGGDNEPDNMTLSCATCNLKKNAKSAAQFRMRLDLNGK